MQAYRLALLAILCWVSANHAAWAAETIHTWIDAQGVRHFSDKAPPEDARNPEIYLEGGSVSGRADQQNARRHAYDNMVEKAGVEARRLEQERLQEEAARRRQLEEAAQQRRRNALEAKRRELQKKIDALMSRAFSPTFTQGMRDNQIKAIQDQIDQLEKDAGRSKDTP